MPEPLHRRLVLAERPTGAVEATTFREVTEHRSADPAEGQVLLQTLWLALDPAQRGALNDLPSYRPPVQVGETMRGRGIARVADSRHRDFAPGDLVVGEIGWQDWLLGDPDDADWELERVPADLERPTSMLSVLGLTGLTAWVGMTRIARVRAGDRVLVTAAAGATGSVAGQIARAMGATLVVGTAGSAAKREWVEEVAGFDSCVDHHDPKVFRELQAAAPDGFDVVFDNVGGSLLDAALANLALGASVVLCGSISTGYEPKRADIGLRNYQFLTTRRARAEGFIVLDHETDFDEGRRELLGWIRSGELRWEEDVLDGLERAPEALGRLFAGGNLGKQLVRISPVGPSR